MKEEIIKELDRILNIQRQRPDTDFERGYTIATKYIKKIIESLDKD